MSQGQGIAVVAFGGNALIVDDKHASIPDQADAAAQSARHIADMVEMGWKVVVTHGSGPQVGFILRRSELALGEVPPIPIDYADADLQGAIGYMFQRGFHNEYRRRGLGGRQALAIVTQVLVDRDDPAFKHPTKPVGSHMEEAKARRLAAELGWHIMEDAGRGWRRVVPSPEPKAVIEFAAIKQLLEANFTVIACGGGGIPVVADADGDLKGIEAVIDKDLASSLLALQLGAELFVISTGVEKVATNFNRPNERRHDVLSVAEAKRYDVEGHFGAGSMAPKIRAMIRFVEQSGGRGIITDPPNFRRALTGEAGTLFVADSG
jgi:carbamate kinase